MEGLMEGGHAKMRTAGPSPELKASILSRCTWQWVQPFVSIGNNKILEAEDLYDLNPKEGTKHCEQVWNDAIKKAKKNMNPNVAPSVWKLVWLCFGMEYVRAALFKPLALVCLILQVYIVRALIQAVTNEHDLKWWWGAILVLGMFLISTLVSMSHQMCFTLSQKVGMKIRSTISMAVFDKILSLKVVSLMDTNSGLMLNLVTNDTQKLLDAALFFNFVWFALIDLGAISTLAIIEIGVSAIPGVVLAFLTQPIQVWMARVGARLRDKAIKYTDSRVHLTREVLTGIRVIKYNGWTAPFLRQIVDLRRVEIHKIRRASFVRASTSIFRDSITPLASLATFGTYLAIHKGNFMPPSQAFTILALFSVLVRTFSITSEGVQLCGEALVAMRRFQGLLNLDNVDNSGTEDYNQVSKDFPGKAVVLTNCSFSWEQRAKTFISSGTTEESGEICIQAEKNVETEMETHKLPLANGLLRGVVVLENISISVGKGKLVSIHGPVGCGKSSLLSGILGEMQCLKGRVYVQHNIAYVPQQPWILNATVRQNIVFTSPFDHERYQTTIAACALEHDISQFAGGHDTEIGDGGINLSGGQKARISLARACYSATPVVFLDDPFAAVDVPTANHLIEHVLNGILRERTVILVTHNKTALSVCEQVYSMKNGLLHEQEDLKRRNSSSISTTTAHTSRNKDSTPDSDCRVQLNAIMHVDEIGDSKTHHQSIAECNTSQNLQLVTLESAHAKGKGKSTVEEDRVEGNVKKSTWIAYAKASGGLLFFFFVILVFGQAVRVMVDYWLRIWTDRKYELKQDIYFAAYASFAVGAAILSLSRALFFTHTAIVAASKLHSQMVERVLRSPQLFFDQNVVGRILNRFSKDQALVDEVLPITTQHMFEYAISCLGILIFIGILIPWFLLAFPPVIVIFLFIQHRYVVVSRELKRLEALSRSPLYAHFTQTLQGSASVRAYGVQSKMHDIFVSLIDANHRSYIMFVHMSRWLGIRLDVTASMCITLASALVILLRHSISPGLAGVILVQSMQMAGFIQFAVTRAAETENHLTSVERIHAYTNLPSEADPTTGPGVIEKDWPSRGEIEFVKYTMTYRVDLPPILNEISFKVHEKERIGILGRTGVGKSSLAAALFRMVENKECTGDILIDGISIKRIGLDDLRQRLSIIPQDPTLFQGSLRFNLDPLKTYSDSEIYEALSRVHLTQKIQSLDRGLDSVIAQNGENFSVGQRQLVCLARSLLRRSRIIVMDEATAAIDGETDSLIQATIRTSFDDCTLLTIAHRIETVIDCDRVLILGAGGRIAEFDTPHNLLSCHDQGGAFAEMVRQSGASVSKQLHEAAHAAARRRKELQEVPL